MKFQLFALLLITGLLSCQSTSSTSGPTVKLNEGPSIDMLKTMVDNYLKGNLEANAAYYSDTAVIYRQGYGLPGISVQQDMENTKATLSNFSEYGISDEVYEVVTIDGTDWLHYWGLWTGKLKANGSEVKLPFFMNPCVKDGKIQLMGFYADNSIVVNALAEATDAADGTD